MRKAVEEYLKDCGRRVERPPEEPAPLTLGGLVDGFLVHVLRLDPESYRRAFWREAYRNGHTIGHVPRTFEGFLRRNARTFEQKVSLFLALTALFGVYTVAALLYRRLSLVLRRLRRPAYYERERERRRKLAEARREIRKHHTLNPKPTFDAIRAALRVARSSPESALRLGSLLEDLECFVDNTLIHDVQGQIVGRRGGIKRDGEALPPGLRRGRAHPARDAPARAGDGGALRPCPIARACDCGSRLDVRIRACRHCGRNAEGVGPCPRDRAGNPRRVRGDAHLARGRARAAAGSRLHSRKGRGVRTQARPAAHPEEGRRLARPTTGRLTASFCINTPRPTFSTFPTMSGDSGTESPGAELSGTESPGPRLSFLNYPPSSL